MGFIKSGLFISLDGVIEAPETWHFPYFNDEMGAAVGQLMSEADATLLGRTTYEAFASYWPQADPADDMTAAMNGARKYVVSNTLSEATWENSLVINGDVYASLATLKEETGLSTTGSATLVRSLLEQGIIDELHLLVHPIVVGHGKKLFAADRRLRHPRGRLTCRGCRARPQVRPPRRLGAGRCASRHRARGPPVRGTRLRVGTRGCAPTYARMRFGWVACWPA
jgi:dihydrofolate reductase